MEPDVVVVAARGAYPLYLEYGAYVCQAGRPIRPVPRMAFYTRNEIKPEVPLILGSEDHVTFSRETALALRASGAAKDIRIGELVERLLDDGRREHGAIHKVVLLSEPADERTLTLPQAIRNTSLGPKGRRTAWTQHQRYTWSGALRGEPRTTDDLACLSG